MSMPKVNIFGVPVSRLGFRDTIDLLADAVESRKPHQVITVNPIMVMTAVESPRYMQILNTAELVIPDGAGVVWAAQYAGTPVHERVPGIEIMQELLRKAQQRQWRVYLLGASSEVITAAVEKLKLQYPGLAIAGFRDGYFSAEEDEQVVEAIRQAKPDLLFVGRSADNQEPWIAAHKEALGVPVMMGVGGSFDIISGRLKRAPRIFLKLKLEWFYRLLQEPYRYRRMLVLPRFVMKVFMNQLRG